MIVLPFIAIGAVWFWGFKPLEFASVCSGSIDIPAGTHTVRIRGETGNLQVVIGSAGTIGFKGQSLSVVATADQLDAVKQTPVTLVRDAAQSSAGVLTLKVSDVPDGFRRISSLGVSPQDATDRRPGVFRQVDLEIRVPVDLALELAADESNLRVDTRQASTTLRVKKGKVLVLHTSAALTVRNGGGPTVIQEHRGSLDVEAEDQVRVTLAELTGPVKLISKHGKTSLYLPNHSSFRVEAKSDQSIRNEFGLRGDEVDGFHRLEGAVGDGQYRVSVEAYGGSVTLALTK